MEQERKRGSLREPKEPKKVCFMPDDEVLEYMGEEDEDDVNSGIMGDEDNDLDLDTLAGSSKSRKFKRDVYSDDEILNEEEEDDDDEEIGGQSRMDQIKPPKIDESEEDSDPELDEEEEVKITPFNMRQEREEGDFDDGEDNYRVKQDSEAYQDNWLQGISKADMKRAYEAEQARLAATVMATPRQDKEALLSRLGSFLQPGETVTGALQRRNAGLPPRRVGQKKQTGQFTPAEQERHARVRAEIEEITGLATRLLDQEGLIDIYDTPLK